MNIETVKDLIEHLETHFEDHDKLQFLVNEHQHKIQFLEYSGLGEGDCEIHLSGDVDEEG